MTILHSVSCFLFLYWSPFSSLQTVFDAVSSIIDNIFSINPSTNVFVFRDFNVFHKDWLTYSGRTDRSGELCYIFSISNDLTQVVNFPTWISECDSHSLAHLVLFLSSDPSICSTVAFPPLGNSDGVVISVSIDFPSNSNGHGPFHCTPYDYSYWDSLCDHSRYVALDNISKLGNSAATIEYCERVQFESMYIYLLINIRFCFIYLHGFLVLVLLP